MTNQTHSHIGASAYLDLLRSLKDEAVTDLRGTPILKAVGAKKYWYDNYRIGTESAWKYIGEDTADLRDRLARKKDIRAQAKERAQNRARMVRILRAEGYAGVDRRTGSLLSAFAGAGLFRLGGTIVGTVAFQLYEGELGVRMRADHLAQTDDLDIASFERLSLALNDQVSEPTHAILKGMDFDAVPSLAGGRVWKWRQASSETLVEFLTPSFGEEGIRDLPALGVSAQALHHLNYLIAEPIAAVAIYRSGILVQIPRPERYAIHKLIVADRRRTGTESLKARKDRAQAGFLIEVLAEDRPDDLAEAYADALSRGPKWRHRLEATLARMPDSRATLARVS